MADIACGCFGVSLLFPMLYYYASWARTQAVAVPLSAALVVASGAAIIVIGTVSMIWSIVSDRSTAATSLAIGSLLVLVIEVGLVQRLKVGGAFYQARELASPSPQFLYKNRFDMRDLELNLAQENLFKWPDREKRAMTLFLEDEKRRTVIRR